MARWWWEEAEDGVERIERGLDEEDMLLLVVFRPNLENRVAMLMLSPEWFPRRRAA